MTDMTSMLSTPLSPGGHVGRQANIILQGPKSMIWDPEIEGEPPFWGWPVLSLETITATLPARIESRSVYANLTDDTQPFAVLRAVYWNWDIAKKMIEEQQKEDIIRPTIPARFVKLQMIQLGEWLSVFNNISVTIDGSCVDDDEVPIRKLRIEQDYTSCIFEKVWQTQDVNHNPLNQKWDQVWQQMTEALKNGSHIFRLKEDYRLLKFEFNYDFEVYQPDQFDFS
jgi:hypothetical protein